MSDAFIVIKQRMLESFKPHLYKPVTEQSKQEIKASLMDVLMNAELEGLIAAPRIPVFDIRQNEDNPTQVDFHPLNDAAKELLECNIDIHKIHSFKKKTECGLELSQFSDTKRNLVTFLWPLATCNDCLSHQEK